MFSVLYRFKRMVMHMRSMMQVNKTVGEIFKNMNSLIIELVIVYRRLYITKAISVKHSLLNQADLSFDIPRYRRK